jgi:ribosomal protein S24E
MKLRILSKEYNPLLKRKEVTFQVEHTETGGTPNRFEIRKQLAALLKTDLELIYVRKIETRTGTMTAVGEANAYDFVEQAKIVEPKHIVVRNVASKQTEESQKPEKLKELE